MKLPAGSYFIGDPCYAIRDSVGNPDRWSDFCDCIGSRRDDVVTEFEGILMFAGSTAHGDGAFEGSDGNVYGVDAGLLGCVPMELANQSMAEMERLGSIVDFKEDFEVSRSEKGTFRFGHIRIKTDY